MKVPSLLPPLGGPQPSHPWGQQRLRVSGQSCLSGRQRFASGRACKGHGRWMGRAGREQGHQGQRPTEAGGPEKPLLTVALGSGLSSTGLDGTTTGPRGCVSHTLQCIGGAYSASGLLRGSPPQQPCLIPHTLPSSYG